MVDLAGEPGQLQLYHSAHRGTVTGICRAAAAAYLPCAWSTCCVWHGRIKAVVVEALQAYFAGHHDALCRLPLVAAATTFQQRLRHALGQVQCGQVVSYGVLAARLHTAPRAVGRGCASNPLPLVVPCHRVVSADGQPGGFSLGVRRKRWLLRHEGVVL